MLEVLHKELDQDNAKDTAIYTLASIAFYAQIRLGKLVPNKQNTNHFDTSAHPTRKNLAKPHTTHGSSILHLSRMKMEQVKGEDVLLSKQAGITDPINPLANHIACNKIFDKTPIVSYLESWSKCKCITKNSLLK